MPIASLIEYLSLALCGLAIGLVIVRYDLYVREPWYMFILAAALGAVGMHIAYLAEIGLIRALHEDGRLVSGPLLAAAASSIEEITKLGAVALIAVCLPRFFNEPLDGLVYGSFAGLGAALEESVSFLRTMPNTGFLPATEPVRLAGHLVMGGIGGFGMAYVAMRSWRAVTAVPASLAVAVALHTAWDLVAFAASEVDAPHHRPRPASHIILPVVLMFAGMILYRRFVSVGAQMTREWLNVCDITTGLGPTTESVRHR